MKITIMAFVLATVLVCSSGYGATFKGYGVASCESWTKDKAIDGKTYLLNLSWVLGYLSGVNHAQAVGKDFMKDSDIDYLFGWIDSYCNKNPQHKIVDASDALILELNK